MFQIKTKQLRIADSGVVKPGWHQFTLSHNGITASRPWVTNSAFTSKNKCLLLEATWKGEEEALRWHHWETKGSQSGAAHVSRRLPWPTLPRIGHSNSTTSAGSSLKVLQVLEWGAHILSVLGSSQSCYQMISSWPREEAPDKKSFSHLFGSWRFKILHFMPRSLQMSLQQAEPSV